MNETILDMIREEKRLAREEEIANCPYLSLDECQTVDDIKDWLHKWIRYDALKD